MSLPLSVDAARNVSAATSAVSASASSVGLGVARDDVGPSDSVATDLVKLGTAASAATGRPLPPWLFALLIVLASLGSIGGGAGLWRSIVGAPEIEALEERIDRLEAGAHKFEEISDRLSGVEMESRQYRVAIVTLQSRNVAEWRYTSAAIDLLLEAAGVEPPNRPSLPRELLDSEAAEARALQELLLFGPP